MATAASSTNECLEKKSFKIEFNKGCSKGVQVKVIVDDLPELFRLEVIHEYHIFLNQDREDIEVLLIQDGVVEITINPLGKFQK